MKRIICILCFLLMFSSQAAAEVSINETIFPDSVFRKYVSGHYDKNEDGKLDDVEISAVTSMYLSDRSIRSLKGIEHFVALSSLECYETGISELDVSDNTNLVTLTCYRNLSMKTLTLGSNAKLTTLNCSRNSLTALNVSENTNLTSLNCSYNSLTALDVTNNTNLTSLNCSYNSLTELDVSKNTVLTNLECEANRLSENNGKLDLSNNMLLTHLSCGYNGFTELDVSKNTVLTHLSCGYNSLPVLDVSNNKALLYLSCEGNRLGADDRELNLKNNLALAHLSCGYNGFKKLDVKINTALTDLACEGNKLGEEGRSLDIRSNVNLKSLTCGYNGFAELDVTRNIKLTDLWCGHNELTELDLTNNTALQRLWIGSNHFTDIDLSKNTKLLHLLCEDNELGELDVTPHKNLNLLWCDNNYLEELDLPQNTQLAYLWCGHNELRELDLTNNKNLSVLWCSHNHLAYIDVSGNKRLTYFACENQTLDRPGSASFNFKNLGIPSDMLDGIVAKSIKGYDEDGKEIKLKSYNTSTRIASFNSVPARIKYEILSGYEHGIGNETNIIKTLPVIVGTNITEKDLPQEIMQSSLSIYSVSLPDGTINKAYPNTKLTTYATIITSSYLTIDLYKAYITTSLYKYFSSSTSIKWTLEEGKLPDGLKLSPEGVISGKPAECGTFRFTVEATNTVSKTRRTFTIKITGIPPEILTPSPLPNATDGKRYTVSLRGKGDPTLEWSLQSGDHMPEGLSLNKSTGLISGKVNVEDIEHAGVRYFTIWLKNGVGSTSKLYSMDVQIPPGEPPVIVTSSPLPNATEGKNYTKDKGTLKGTGTRPLTWSFISGDLPAGLSFDASKNKIYGTPAIGTARKNEPYKFTIGLKNKLGKTSKDYELYVNGIPPTIITKKSEFSGLTVGKPFSIDIKATGTQPITFIWEKLPAGLSGDANGRIFGIPEEYGKQTVIVIASNDWGSDDKTFYPIIVDDIPKFLYDKILPDAFAGPGYSYRHIFNVVGTPKITLIPLSGDIPPGLKLTKNKLQGKPAKPGVYLFTIAAANPIGTTTKTFKLYVKAISPEIVGKLSNGIVGKKYYSRLTVKGTTPVRWTVYGELPTGVTCKATDKDITFTGTLAEPFEGNITVSADNSYSCPDYNFDTGAWDITFNTGGSASMTYSVAIKDNSKNKKSSPKNAKDSVPAAEVLEAPVMKDTPIPQEDTDTSSVNMDSGNETAADTSAQDTTENTQVGNSNDYVIVCELPEISADVPGMYDFDVVLSDDVEIGAKLIWLSGSDTPSDDDRIAEFYDDEGKETETVPGSRNITVSAWLNSGRKYKPAIAVKR